MDCRTQIINLIQIALQSAYTKQPSNDDGWCRVEIMRNQACFGPHHSQSAFVCLRKLHDIAQTNAIVSHSHSRMQGGEAKFTARTPTLAHLNGDDSVSAVQLNFDTINRKAKGSSGERVP